MKTFLLLATSTVDATHGPGGSSFATWGTLHVLLAALSVIALIGYAVGPSGTHRSAAVRTALRLPLALARWTGLPAWAAVTLTLSGAGLVIAGTGFFDDVAYHVAYGRDTVLFTAPHTAIVIGLTMIAVGAWAGVAVATVQEVDTDLRFGRLRLPWSSLPLGVLGLAALLGFPIDEAWHQTYGVDVTMWSPPHLIMILGAAFSGLALWLVVAETGVRPSDDRRARAVHGVLAFLTFQGLTAPMGEFAFGVPQFQQLYHPVLICLAAGTGLVLIRLVLGRGGALTIAAISFALDHFAVLGDGPVDTRPVATFLGAAFAVEAVAWLHGTRPRLRFSVLAGLAVGTVGLATEWVYNQGAHQPWTSALLPDAVIVGVPAAVAAAVLGGAIARALPDADAVGAAAPLAPTRSGAVLVVAGLTVVAALAIPLPRQVGEVTAELHITEVEPGQVLLEARLDPPDAADGARWFMLSSWQHGTRESAHLVPQADGSWRTQTPVAVDGWAKSLLRLHRGAEMMTIPVRLPADPDIGEPEIEPRSRTAAFEAETRYLLRETTEGPPALRIAVTAVFILLVGAWVVAFSLASTRLASRAAAGGRDAPRHRTGHRARHEVDAFRAGT
ncbi:MAG: hypothetical protein WEB03_03650 [Nitriliruptor sp.]|uniref:hypothetical protein n=1 Tax=Nitriliruptor sp. TaxID=2448056 RepID=UPI00349FDAC2